MDELMGWLIFRKQGYFFNLGVKDIFVKLLEIRNYEELGKWRCTSK